MSVQGVYTCCSASAGAQCGGSMQGLPLPASQVSAHAVSRAHGTLLSSVTTEPTLKSPTWLSIKPLVRAELAFPKFSQRILWCSKLFPD